MAPHVLTAVVSAGGDGNLGDLGGVLDVVLGHAVGGVGLDALTAGNASTGVSSRLPVGTVGTSGTLHGGTTLDLVARGHHCISEKNNQKT